MTTGVFVSASSSSFFSLILLMQCQKWGNWAAASRRKGITYWKIRQSLISVLLKCIRRESIHLKFPKSAPDQRWQQLLFWIKMVNVQESLCRVAGLCCAGNQSDRKFKLLASAVTHSTTMKRHVTCFVEKARFEPRTVGTQAERYDHCSTRPVDRRFKFIWFYYPSP